MKTRLSGNIETIQVLVKNSIDDILTSNGYELFTYNKHDEKQALLLQWANTNNSHAFQLLWDIKERWFSLSEFNRIDNLNYVDSNQIGLFPFTAFGVLFRESYNAKYVQKIESKVKEILHSKGFKQSTSSN